MGFKYSIDFTVAFSKTQSFRKLNLKTKYDIRGVSVFSIISIYLIQFTMDQNCYNSCWKQTARLKIGY